MVQHMFRCSPAGHSVIWCGVVVMTVLSSLLALQAASSVSLAGWWLCTAVIALPGRLADHASNTWMDINCVKIVDSSTPVGFCWRNRPALPRVWGGAAAGAHEAVVDT
jgi:hypothetical protein